MERLKFLFVLGVLALTLHSAKGEERGYSIGTNLVEWMNLGTMNIQCGMSLTRHFTLHAEGRINPFEWQHSGKALMNKQASARISARYWPWFIYSGWNMEGGALYSRYRTGGILSPETEEGDAFGISLSGGYSLMVTRRINIEFGIGLWGGVKWYTLYEKPKCGKLISQGEKFFIAPDEINISIVFTL